MTDQNKQLSPATFKRLTECRTLGEAFRTQDFAKAVEAAVPKHLTPTRMLRAFEQTVSRTPLLKEVPLRQMLGQFMALAQLGLEPGTFLGLAHILPFERTKWNAKTKQREHVGYDAQIIIGYPGYQDLARRSGAVTVIHADVVWPSDDFDYEYGTQHFLRHRPRPGKREGDPAYAYAYADFKGEGVEFEVMFWNDVERIRNLSQAYRTALRAKEEAEKKGWRLPATWIEAPWVKHHLELGKKTAFRRLSKWLPRCPELAAAVAMEDAQDEGRLDFGPIIEGEAHVVEGGVPMADQQEDDGQGDAGADDGRAETKLDERTVQTSVKPPTEPKPTTDVKPATQVKTEKPAAKVETKSEPKPEPKTEPKQETKITSAPEWPVIDEFGERYATCHTAERFATVLVDVWSNAKNRQAVIEHNEGVIGNAMADLTAAGLLRDLVSPDDGNEEGDSAPPSLVMEPVLPIKSRNREHWNNYPAQIKGAIEAEFSEAELLEWLAIQRPVLMRAPLATRIDTAKILSDAALDAGLNLAGHLAEILRADDQPGLALSPNGPGDDQEATIERILAVLETVDSREAFQALASTHRAFMASLHRANPARFDAVDNAFKAVGDREGWL